MPLKLKAFYKNIKKIVSYIKAPTIAIPPALYAFFISIFRFLRDYTLRIFSIASKRLTKRLTIALFVFIITFFIFVLFLFNRDLFNFTDVTKNRLFNVFFVFPHWIYCVLFSIFKYLFIVFFSSFDYIIYVFTSNYRYLCKGLNMPEEKSYVLLLSIYVHYIFCIHVYKFIIFLFPIKDLIEKTNEVDTPYILILKYLGFFFRKPINLYNLLFVSAVRFRLFFIHYILSYKIILFKHLFAKVSVLKKFFWRPLFKKWSYYGLYRSFKSRWLKK